MSQLTLDPAKIAESMELVEGAHSRIKETAFQLATGLPTDLSPATTERLQLELAQVLRAASSSVAEIERLATELATVISGFHQRATPVTGQLHDANMPTDATQLLDRWTENIATTDSEVSPDSSRSLAAFADDLLAAQTLSADARNSVDPGHTRLVEDFSNLAAPGLQSNQISAAVNAMIAWSGTLPARAVPSLEIASMSLLDQSSEHAVHKFSLADDSQAGESSQNRELRRHAFQRLEDGSDIVLLITPAADGQAHFLHTLLVDSGFGVFLTNADGEWSVSEPVAIDDVIWSLVDQIGTPTTGDAGASPSSIILRRTSARSASETGEEDLQLAPAEELFFAGPVGSMQLMLGAGDRFDGRVCSEEELFELLSVALGPAIDPPEWPTDPGSHAAVSASESRETPLPSASGGLNRISLAACESAAREPSAAGWHRTLANPQIVARIEPLDPLAAAADKFVLSIAADNAVQWQAVDDEISFEAFDEADVTTQLKRLLGETVVNEVQTLPEGLLKPIPASRLQDEVTTLLAHGKGQDTPTVRQFSVVVAIKAATGLISGEELELLAIDRYGTFLVEPADSGNVCLTPTTAAALADRLVLAAFG